MPRGTNESTCVQGTVRRGRRVFVGVRGCIQLLEAIHSKVFEAEDVEETNRAFLIDRRRLPFHCDPVGEGRVDLPHAREEAIEGECDGRGRCAKGVEGECGGRGRCAKAVEGVRRPRSVSEGRGV